MMKEMDPTSGRDINQGIPLNHEAGECQTAITAMRTRRAECRLRDAILIGSERGGGLSW